MSQYPECDKLLKVNDKSQIIGEFLDWLREKQHVICEYGDDDLLYPSRYTIDELLSQFFNIDLDKVEDERRMMLEKCRRQ